MHKLTQNFVPCVYSFVNERTDAYSNTIASTWRHMKAFLSPYNRKADYIHHLVHYMFAARCKAEKMDQFTRLLHLVATIDWSECPTTSESLIVCQPPSLRLQPKVKAHARSNNTYRVVFWETCCHGSEYHSIATIQERPQHHIRQTATSLHSFSKLFPVNLANFGSMQSMRLSAMFV